MNRQIAVLLLMLMIGGLPANAGGIALPTSDRFGVPLQEPVTGYGISHNPAFFQTEYTRDFTLYTLAGEYRFNDCRRLYDPASERNYHLKIATVRNLNDRSSLATGIRYYRTELQQLYRSLEKDFYATYFAFADTTTGNVDYAGPLLTMLYTYQGARLSFGAELTYGVERGLKDVYTQCETVGRDTDLLIGLGFRSLNRRLSIGLTGRYFNSQRIYEAVKRIQSATVDTYIGYHQYYREGPRDINRKNTYRRGYELSWHLERQRLPAGLGFMLVLTTGCYTNIVDVGSVGRPQPRGYLYHAEQSLWGTLFNRRVHKNLTWQVYVLYRWIDEWATPGRYAVVKLRNKDETLHLGLLSFYHLSARLEGCTGLEYVRHRERYNEYGIARDTDFSYTGNRPESRGFIRCILDVSPGLILRLEGAYRRLTPYFTWEPRRFDITTLEGGVERHFGFGWAGCFLFSERWMPDNSDGDIRVCGLRLQYRK